LNKSVVGRLTEEGKIETSVNAIILLDTFAKAMPYGIEKYLDALRYLFVPYLMEDAEDHSI